MLRSGLKATLDQLHGYAALMDDTRLPGLSKILSEAADGDTMTIEKFGRGFDCKCGDIEATLAVLSQLTFSKRLPLSELATLLQLLHTIENQRRSVERQTGTDFYVHLPSENGVLLSSRRSSAILARELGR